ncbi:hypothetical protein GCM10010233_10060 [Streptomyces pseudogriseolus]|nr:hypothetical protein GCM10010233_10060 [Streptomyces gancidicus]
MPFLDLAAPGRPVRQSRGFAHPRTTSLGQRTPAPTVTLRPAYTRTSATYSDDSYAWRIWSR